MSNTTENIDAEREAVARAICVACEEMPDHIGDARGNAFRWQDYLEIADAAIAATHEADAEDVEHFLEMLADACVECDIPDSTYETLTVVIKERAATHEAEALGDKGAAEQKGGK